MADMRVPELSRGRGRRRFLRFADEIPHAFRAIDALPGKNRFHQAAENQIAISDIRRVQFPPAGERMVSRHNDIERIR